MTLIAPVGLPSADGRRPTSRTCRSRSSLRRPARVETATSPSGRAGHARAGRRSWPQRPWRRNSPPCVWQSAHRRPILRTRPRTARLRACRSTALWNDCTKSAPASTDRPDDAAAFGIAGTVPSNRPSMPGLVAPATAMVHPSQLMPASQYTWMFLSGPSGRRSARCTLGRYRVAAVGGCVALDRARRRFRSHAPFLSNVLLADPRQLFAGEHGDHPLAADERRIMTMPVGRRRPRR